MIGHGPSVQLLRDHLGWFKSDLLLLAAGVDKCLVGAFFPHCGFGDDVGNLKGKEGGSPTD